MNREEGEMVWDVRCGVGSGVEEESRKVSGKEKYLVCAKL